MNKDLNLLINHCLTTHTTQFSSTNTVVTKELLFWSSYKN